MLKFWYPEKNLMYQKFWHVEISEDVILTITDIRVPIRVSYHTFWKSCSIKATKFNSCHRLLNFLDVCMVNTMEAPRKFIIAELSICKLGSSLCVYIMYLNISCFWTPPPQIRQDIYADNFTNTP